MGDSQTSSRFKLPGFGLPLNFIPQSKNASVMFPNALSTADLLTGAIQLPLITLREISMLQLMNEITDKTDWHLKIFDDSITAKWNAEILQAQEGKYTPAMVKYCISELRHKAEQFQKVGAVTVYNGEVVKSDVAIPASLQEELRSAVVVLEDIPEKQKDWHPGSDSKVLDLVHPSLFPLVYGKSRILKTDVTNLRDPVERCGEGMVLPVPPLEESGLFFKPGVISANDIDNSSKPYSRHFQWLPCDIDISGPDEVKITSYINNLHPHKHKDLYAVIEKIIARAIPLWNLSLTPLKYLQNIPPRISYDECIYDPDPEEAPEFRGKGPQQAEGESYNYYWHRREQWILSIRKIVQPEPNDFVAPEPPAEFVDLRRDHGKTGLQVIVKLANIHLTPERPSYAGGTWHVEGQLNEHICASALYYYDTLNITPSSLAFRQQSQVEEADDIGYRQHQHEWLEEVFGCQNEGPAVQNVGSIDTREGRLLTWPNILQHQVQPFQLADPTKSGHRKILALFLVDPNLRIISTANVPCQQKEWWGEAILQDSGPLSRFPPELRDEIFAHVDNFPLGIEDAKEIRLRLMEERKRYSVWHGEKFEEVTFSLCEH